MLIRLGKTNRPFPYLLFLPCYMTAGKCPAPLGRSMAQVPGGDQLLVDDCVPLAAVPEVALQQEAAVAGLQDWGSQGGSWGCSIQGGSWAWEGFLVMAGSAEDTVQEEALRRFDSIFRYLHRKSLGHF